nr:hypothetical protein [Tanacetum cinerariifolium]
MIQMLQHIDREDLETLWMLVKAKYGNTRPEDGYERVLDLEKAKTAQANEIANLKKKVKKLERKKKSRTLGDQDDASKQGRMIDNIDQIEEITLVDETLRRMNEKGMFGLNDLDGDEVIMDATAGEEVDQSTKVAKNEVSTADPVTTAEDVKVTTTATTPQISKDELTLSQTLIEIKAAKPKTKEKDQIAFDEEVARKLIAHMKAKMEEEERIAREEDEANIAKLDDQIEAKVDNDQREAKMKIYMKIILDDGSSKRYSSMIQMLQHIDREDLETLWMLVKAKYGNTRPEDGYERVL